MTDEYDLGGPAAPAVARSRRRRLRAGGIVLVLAGLVTAAAFIGLPAVAAAHSPSSSVGAGLPDHWSLPPADAPDVRDWPMTAASMLLVDEQARWTLVSTGGNRYARLPLGKADYSPALSDDGRLVAWLHGKGKGTLHVLRLADGREVVRRVPVANFDPISLRWSRGSFELAGWSLRPGATEALPGEVTMYACYRGTVEPHALGSISLTVRVEPPRPDSGLPCAKDAAQAAAVPANLGGDYLQFSTVHDPGRGSEQAALLRIGRHGVYWLRVGWLQDGTVYDYEEYALPARGVNAHNTDARVLAWTPAGIVVRVTTVAGINFGDRVTAELRLIDPDDGSERVLSSAERFAYSELPMAVAPDVVGDGRTVAAPAPSQPTRTVEPAGFVAIGRRLSPSDARLAVLLEALPAVLLVAGVALLALSTRRAVPLRP